MCSSDYLFAFPSHHHVVCVFNIRVLFQVASIFISVYDETYSVFGLVRLVFLSEFTCRMINSGYHAIRIVVMLLRLLPCAMLAPFFCWKKDLSMICRIFLLYFPLYGIQVKNIVIRQCLSILAPVCLTVYGICISEHLGCFVCRSNHTLYG